MEDFFISHGFLTLFILSFLASTILPLGSEWLLIALILNGHNPTVSVSIATVGNTLGACTTYWIGFWGAPFIIEKLLRIDKEQQLKAEQMYNRYGSWSLLFSWVPIIGDPLCLAGGVLNIRFNVFLPLVFCGKLGRYILVAVVTIKGFTG